MPVREVKTIQDLIFYQYAKIIAKSSFNVPDGQAAKREHYGFIKNKFRELRDGEGYASFPAGKEIFEDHILLP